MKFLSATLSIVLAIHAVVASTEVESNNHNNISIESHQARERLLQRYWRNLGKRDTKPHKRHHGGGGKDHHNNKEIADAAKTTTTDASTTAAAEGGVLTEWQIAELAYALESQHVVPLPQQQPVAVDSRCTFCSTGLTVDPGYVIAADNGITCGAARA